MVNETFTNKKCGSISSRAHLIQLVDKEIIIKILDAFTNVTGLTANIVDVEGHSIFSKKDAQKNCEFCHMIWKMEKQKGISRCVGAYARAGKQAAIFDEPYIFRCPAGLIEWAAPIIFDEEHLGTIICGQVLMWEPEEFFWIELEEMNRFLTDDFKALFEAAKKLQVVSGEKVQGAASLLHVIANYIIKTGGESLHQKKEIELQQLLLNEEIQTRKNLEEKLNSQSLNFFLEKEKALIGKIKLSDLDECRKLFKVMLADIFSCDGEKLLIMKGRVYELVVVMSRACVEAGVDIEKSMGFNANLLQELNNCYSIREINIVANSLLERYLDEIHHHSKSKNRSAVEGIKGFIRNNYAKNNSLEEIADSVYLSPFYVSRIFKESQNMTVMDYVTKVKLDEAKKMLSNPRYKIEEIAMSLGYSDGSYFSKVFRRNEGMTPTQFRQNL
ncbi:PocR ligand-binding domain-containing protein [Acetobacterium sp.]|uniref:PocR ligand-binding domain-containing protein n=1 Tax=Acetobacterium sp. TaxID=1872094 RepID=UPI000CAA8BAE|nr:PocR ligand-binding domain-containing protein [Acetobacterium sp.]MDO9493907.1 PocR ligand-binding domain-containing protein [Acetobacterium sp.]PKM74945.1 MAG: AraC family transcriptional regulator [Firmicutes bacterium HGW-Firmicutes-17]